MWYNPCTQTHNQRNTFKRIAQFANVLAKTTVSPTSICSGSWNQLPSRSVLTPRGSLECNPEIPAFHFGDLPEFSSPSLRAALPGREGLHCRGEAAPEQSWRQQENQAGRRRPGRGQRALPLRKPVWSVLWAVVRPRPPLLPSLQSPTWRRLGPIFIETQDPTPDPQALVR